MKSIADYLEGSEGTKQAIGKTFELYGMVIGKFAGATTQTKLVFVKDEETMEVPVHISLPQFNLPGQILNPLLKEITEA